MIGASDVSAVIVTRGDVPLLQVCEPLLAAGIHETVIWDNSKQQDLAVYGRYRAIENADKHVILVVDDDVALSRQAINGLLKAYERGVIVANMPPEYRTRYTDSCLLGFGAIFDAELPANAFEKVGFNGYCSPWPENEWYDFHFAGDRDYSLVLPDSETFRRTCDIFFTTFTPFKLLDLPFTMLPWTRAPNRMYLQKGNTNERQQMLDLARRVRDGS